MFTQEVLDLQAEHDHLQGVLGQAITALNLTDAIVDNLETLPRDEHGQKALDASLTILMPYIGFESISDFGDVKVTDEEPSMEALKDLPRKIYSAIAKLIDALVKRFRALFNFSERRAEAAARKTENALDLFLTRVADSEQTINSFGLEPGAKPTPEQLTALQEVEATYMSDASGNVLTKDMYYNDMALLVPANFRSDPATLSYLLLNGKYDNLITNLQNTCRFIGLVNANADRPNYARYVDRLMSVREQTDVDALFGDLRKDVVNEDMARIGAMDFLNTKNLKNARVLLGDRWPTLIPERSGILAMHSMHFSGQRGRLVTAEQAPKIPRKLPKVTFADVEAIRTAIGDLETKKATMRSSIERTQKVLQAHSGTSGDALKSAAEELGKLDNGRNGKDIESLRALIRNISKHDSIAYSHLTQTYSYVDRLLMSLNAFVVLIVGEE